jgi:uncharacterized membrane protein
MKPPEYLRRVEAGLAGGRSARERLLTELRDHIEDALADPARAGGEAEQEVVARLGDPREVTVPWRADVLARRGQVRRRAALLTLTLATTLTLGIAQHASGHRPPSHGCTGRTAAAHASCPNRAR